LCESLGIFKKWLKAQPNQPATIEELQHHIDAFVDIYNNHRPHRSLKRATPATIYTRLPKDSPTGSTAGTHHRIRYDRIDETGSVSLRRAGRMHHIGIGRAHKHVDIIMIIDDLDITVIATRTGDLLRRLTLDPNRGYQPRFKT